MNAPDNGAGVAFDSVDVDPVDDQAWTTVEIVLLQLNLDYTPSGRFPLYTNDSVRPDNPRAGYDAAVCVQRYEPWIVETYNTSSALPSTLRVVEKGNGSNSSSPSGNIRGAPITNTGYLNATGKGPAFAVAHRNSINQMVKDSGRDPYSIPSLTVGPVVLLHATFLLILTYSTGYFFHQWHWTSGVHRTLQRSTCHCPWTGWCCQLSTIPCRVWNRCCKIV